MQCQELSQEENGMTVKFGYSHPVEAKMQKITSPVFICGALSAEFEFIGTRCMNVTNNNGRPNNPIPNNMTQFNSSPNNLIRFNPILSNADYCLTVSVRFQKLLSNDNFTYICKVESNGKKVGLQIYDIDWHRIAFYKEDNLAANGVWNKTLDYSVKCEISVGQSVFASLYDDTESTDFKLCGEGSYVRVHRTILAAFSPVLQRMLVGEWKETEEARVALPGVSVQTLQNLKDFMYLNKLPETGLQELGVLASCYMMSKLVIACCAQILNKLNADNFFEASEFAVKNRFGPLYIAILKTTQGKTPKILFNKLTLNNEWKMDFSENNYSSEVEDDGKSA